MSSRKTGFKRVSNLEYLSGVNAYDKIELSQFAEDQLYSSKNINFSTLSSFLSGGAGPQGYPGIKGPTGAAILPTSGVTSTNNIISYLYLNSQVSSFFKTVNPLTFTNGYLTGWGLSEDQIVFDAQNNCWALSQYDDYLVGYYGFDEQGGVRYNHVDQNWNSYTAAIDTNFPIGYETAKKNRGILFDAASSNYLIMDQWANHVGGASTLFISVWIKLSTLPNSGSYYNIFYRNWQGSTTFAGDVVNTGGDIALRFSISDQGNPAVCTSNILNIVSDTWYHVCFIAGNESGRNMYIYLDGELVCTPVSISYVLDGPTYDPTLYIGYDPNGGATFFNGTMDEMGIWYGVLYTDQDEVETKVSLLYNFGNGNFFGRSPWGFKFNNLDKYSEWIESAYPIDNEVPPAGSPNWSRDMTLNGNLLTSHTPPLWVHIDSAFRNAGLDSGPVRSGETGKPETTFVYSMWIQFASYPTLGNPQTIFDKEIGGGPSNHWFCRYEHDGSVLRLYSNIWQADAVNIEAIYNKVFNLNTWYHIVMLTDGAYLRIYVDAVQVASAAYDGTLYDTPLNVGHGIGTEWNDVVSTNFLSGPFDEPHTWHNIQFVDTAALNQFVSDLYYGGGGRFWHYQYEP